MVRELYENSVPDASSAQNLILRVLENLIKSNYEKEDGSKQIVGQWEEFLARNVRSSF